MKFENVKNVERLFQIIRDECSGTVELVSSEGDRINLQSRLSQYISMVRLLEINNSQNTEKSYSSPKRAGLFFIYRIFIAITGIALECLYGVMIE